jgi:HxlR-like helix-turn-helix
VDAADRCDLGLGLDRFDDLAVDLGVSRNVLTTRLRDLVENGLVARDRYSKRPPRDRYVLMRAGRGLVPVLGAHRLGRPVSDATWGSAGLKPYPSRTSMPWSKARW